MKWLRFSIAGLMAFIINELPACGAQDTRASSNRQLTTDR
jgi:hypothetical protein